MDTEDFFNQNKNVYATVVPKNYDFYFINYIKSNLKNDCNLLDIGGGSGLFAKLVKENINDISVCVVDPSIELLNKEKNDDVKKIIGYLPNNLNVVENFDFIHIKEVLHHITGTTRSDSKKKVIESLISAKKHMKNEGKMFINENYQESWLFEPITNILIFYLLKVQNFLGIRIPSKHFLLGLDVYFYTRKEIESIFNEANFEIFDYYNVPWENNFYKKILFLKDWGSICYILKEKRN